MTKRYELSYLLSPVLSEEEIETWREKIIATLGEFGAIVDDQKPPQRKQLAYSIRHHDQAVYITVRFEAPTTLASAFQERFRYEPALLRYLMIEELREPIPRPEVPRMETPEQPPAAVSITEEPKQEKPTEEKVEEAVMKDIDERLQEILGP